MLRDRMVHLALRLLLPLSLLRLNVWPTPYVGNGPEGTETHRRTTASGEELWAEGGTALVEQV